LRPANNADCTTQTMMPSQIHTGGMDDMVLSQIEFGPRGVAPCERWNFPHR
jgi:hypothetical protein